LSCLACNVASCACSGVMSCCGKMIPVSRVAGRILYTVVFFLVAMVAWIFRTWAQQLLSKVPVLSKCTEAPEDEAMCYGTLAVYRISFGLALFHLLMSLLMIGVSRRGDPRTTIQDGWWGVKIIFLVGVIVGAFFIPNPFFDYFGWIALVASALFIIVQLLLLVDFAHGWADSWIGKYEESEEGDRTWFVLLLGTTIVLYTFSVAASIVMIIFFCHSGCTKNIAFLTMNVILCFFISFMSIHPKVQDANKRSGLLQSAVITAYSTYLIWSSMMSDSSSCNPWYQSAGASHVSVLIGAIFTIIAVCYTTIRAANSVGSVDASESAPLMKEEEGTESEPEKEKETDKDADANEPVGYNYSRFHFIFALGALYIAMLMSDWHTVYKGDDGAVSVDTGLAALWVKAVSSWVCIGLYIWTLIAPFALPDRDWSF